MSEFNRKVTEHSSKITIGFLLLAFIMKYLVFDHIYSYYSINGFSVVAFRIQFTGLIVLLIMLISAPIILRRIDSEYKDVLFTLFSAITVFLFLLHLLLDITVIYNHTGVYVPNKTIIVITILFAQSLLSYFIAIMSKEFIIKGNFVIKESMGLVFLYSLLTGLAFITSTRNLLWVFVYSGAYALIAGLLFFNKESRKVYQLIIGFIIISQLYYVVDILRSQETRALWLINIMGSNMIMSIFLILSLLLIIKKKNILA